MLTVIRDEQRRILGCCESILVDEQGAPHWQGRYVAVIGCEISQGADGWCVLRDMIAEVLFYCPTAEWGYWTRNAKTHSKPHYFSRKRFEAFVKREVRV